MAAETENCVSMYLAMNTKPPIMENRNAQTPRMSDMKVRLVTNRRMALKKPVGR